MNLNPVDNYLHGSWEALGSGAPMLVAFAQMCNDTWVHRRDLLPLEESFENLSGHAKTILFAAARRGMIEIKAVNSAFEAAARTLAVYIEIDEDRTVVFRDAANPEVTMQFLSGFRELCSAGFIIHHIARDFSLAPEAFSIAKAIPESDIAALLSQATEFGLHDG